MKKEEKLAFEYGQTAAASGWAFAPCYDRRMHTLVSEARSETAQRRNLDNMRAWRQGYLAHTASSGEGISPEMFTAAIGTLIDGESEAAAAWIRFAGECVDMDQYVDFAEKGAQAQPINHWLETLLAGLLEIRKSHGAAIAKQVCDLALRPACLYPSEMPQAADHFRRGGAPEDIDKMIESGAVEGDPPFFPRLVRNAGQESPAAPGSGSHPAKTEKSPPIPKPFRTGDGMTVEFTLIMLCSKDRSGAPLFEELFIGGRVHSLYVADLPGFKAFAQKCGSGEPIQVDNYCYELAGTDWHSRKATRAEMGQIIDGGFPHNYSGSVLRCIDHEGPDQFMVVNGILYDRIHHDQTISGPTMGIP